MVSMITISSSFTEISQVKITKVDVNIGHKNNMKSHKNSCFSPVTLILSLKLETI